MILKKHLADDTSSSSSATILGLKVVGGRIIEGGRLGAIVEKVKKGSIADTIGRLRPGLAFDFKKTINIIILSKR